MKKYLISAIVLLLSFSQVAMASFSDVSSSTDYEDSILWMADNGVIDGYPDGTFQPDRCVNRVELLKMLFEMLGVNIYESGYELFPDTYADQWYAPYVRTARQRGTVVGYPDGFFKPDQCVNRVEAMKMAVLEFNNGGIPDYRGMHGLSFDIANIEGRENMWWWEYYDYAMSAGVVGTDHFKRYNADWSGHNVSSDFANPTFDFEPAGPMSRKEVAEMLYRLKAARDNGVEYYDPTNVPDSLIIAFDACGDLGDYADEPWFDDLESKYQEEFLEPQGLSGELLGFFGEGCLALDESMFIFIPPYAPYDCGKIMRYDINEDELSWPSEWYCATEFWKRIGNYVEFTGWEGGEDTGIRYNGIYFYLENRVDLVNMDMCAIEPYLTDIGRYVYPTASKYGNLRFLGELFTAAECGEDRLSNIFGVDGDDYVLGSNLFLCDAPSQGLLDTLLSIGYYCNEDADDEDCINWRLMGDVTVDEILQLEEFYQELCGNDCISCG